jgi:hypothetical protein
MARGSLGRAAEVEIGSGGDVHTGDRICRNNGRPWQGTDLGEEAWTDELTWAGYCLELLEMAAGQDAGRGQGPKKREGVS